MSCQVNPNSYAIEVRCPLEYGAKLESLADKADSSFGDMGKFDEGMML